MYDAVKLFASSLREFSEESDIEIAPCDCSNPSKWPQGKLILKYFDKVFSTKIGF